jgi:PPOX class probable F420-dependent enzyme
MTQRNTLTENEKAFIEKLRVARLGTADENGTPYLVPVCYAVDNNNFYTPLDEKPKRVPGTKLRRVRNIEARPEVALLIDQYTDDWSQLGYVLIHGHAELIGSGIVKRTLCTVQKHGIGAVPPNYDYPSAHHSVGASSL